VKLTIKELNDVIEARYGDPDRFLANAKRWMFDAGITQSALAAESGIDTSNINRWFNNHVSPSVRNMLILDEALERLLEQFECEIVESYM
jgi:transcriptional regulator with XRE-family HTH domain